MFRTKPGPKFVPHPENGWVPKMGSAQIGTCKNFQVRIYMLKAIEILKETKLPSGN